jgi:hypothetical protein
MFLDSAPDYIGFFLPLNRCRTVGEIWRSACFDIHIRLVLQPGIGGIPRFEGIEVEKGG